MKEKYLKEKARYAFIREKTKLLRERPRHTFDVPGHFAVQEPEQEKESSAADQVQRAAEYAAHSILLFAKRHMVLTCAILARTVSFTLSSRVMSSLATFQTSIPYTLSYRF